MILHNMTRFVRRSLVALFMQLMLVVPAGLLAADDAAQLIEQAEQLARSKQIAAALEKIDAAVAEMDHTQAAEERISWQGMNGLRFAAQLAHDELLDYDKAFTYCDKLTELADSDYWRVPAQLERADLPRNG